MQRLARLWQVRPSLDRPQLLSKDLTQPLALGRVNGRILTPVGDMMFVVARHTTRKARHEPTVAMRASIVSLELVLGVRDRKGIEHVIARKRKATSRGFGTQQVVQLKTFVFRDMGV